MAVTANLTDYTDVHRQLMERLQSCLDTITLLSTTLAEAREELTLHNTDGTSHPDIRALLADAGNVDLDQVDERVSQHNTSVTAHADIRALIDQAKEDTSAASVLITELIAEHNVSPAAHADIREILNTINVKLGDLDLTSVNNELKALAETVNTTVMGAITSLQNKDAQHDSLIAANTDAISKLTIRVQNVASDMATIANSNTAYREDLDELLMGWHNIETGLENGIVFYDPNGPRLQDFTCTLPLYVANNATAQFYFDGAKGKEDSNPVTISIRQIKGDYTLSKNADIELEESIRFTAGGTNKAGDIMDFIADVKDTVTNVTCSRIFSVMSSRPMADGAISLPGLTELINAGGVEPGAQIKFTIGNLNDSGDGRYTYDLNPLQSGITFEPKNVGLVKGEEVTLTIPISAPRDTDLTFRLTVHDSMGSDTNIDVTVHINPMPDLEGFEHTAPAVVIPGQAYNVKFSGVKSAFGKDAIYAIKNEAPELTFSKKESILANENVVITVGAGAIRGNTLAFTVETTDENNVHLETQIQMQVNQLPVAAGVTTDLKSEYRGGQTVVMHISGGTDRDSEKKSVSTYRIDGGSTAFVFSKTENILPSDAINVTLPKVADDSDREFYIYAVDDLGEISLDKVTIKVKLTPIYVATTPRITAPTNNAELQYEDGVTVSWTEFAYTVDVSGQKGLDPSA